MCIDSLAGMDVPQQYRPAGAGDEPVSRVPGHTIGISAPKETAVHRQETCLLIEL
jgi:hypothetical protein